MEVCRHCGRSEEDHCIYSPREIPDGCQCDPMEWDAGEDIPTICSKFVAEVNCAGQKLDYCATCCHDESCHKQTETAP